MGRPGTNTFGSALLVGAVLCLTPFRAEAGPPPDDGATKDVLVEFHFQPVGDAQIAIWLEDAEGNFVADVFVTQATGTLGIGNRPGRWDFLSSWRFPYGPRPQVLPVWAHRRGKTYPRLVFHDDDETDQDSLGWHENSSSPEPYYCRPLNEDEHATISVDTMTCPSPSTFQSDKGRFSNDESVYPPRGDLVEFEEQHDHADVRMFSVLNDLDAVSMATPQGDVPALVTTVIPADVAQQGPMTAYIEINTEADQNPDYTFDREDDHWVDPRLSSFGIPYRGQPSVVYRVDFDPQESQFAGSDAYAGYGDLLGTSGALNPPDGTISTEGSSGADRLALYTRNEETFRFGVFSHGPGTGSSGNPWGECSATDLPLMADVDVEPMEFDTVRVHFTIPDLPDATEIRNVRLYYRIGEQPLDQFGTGAIQSVPTSSECGADLEPGVSTYCDLDELFGSSNYQIGIRYEDGCSNSSQIVSSEVTTPAQEFATVDGFCFVATAAWGANWADKVMALRSFRDTYMKPNAVGYALVAFYYTYSPPLAGAIADSDASRAVARSMLKPMADIATIATAAAQASAESSPGARW